jgi:O-acetyl-ADP-ribose deacetylase (regulator of RNase III)
VTVEYRDGDLFASGLPALAHGCNCAGVMGAGIAVGFRDRWPAMYREYRRSCLDGKFQPGGLYVWHTFAPDGESGQVIFNLMTQPAPGIPAELSAVKSAVTAMTDWAQWHGVPAVGMPRIGAGLGGLPWPQVAEVIEEVAGPSEVRVVVFTLPPGEER